MDKDTRIYKIREYMLEVLKTLLKGSKYEINANMLSKNIDNYSLDRLPVETVIEKYIDGSELRREAYTFRTRKKYTIDIVNNLSNIGFFEDFEELINTNNKKGILPNIEEVISIECLNCGSLAIADTNTAEFDIQIQITYLKRR